MENKKQKLTTKSYNQFMNYLHWKWKLQKIRKGFNCSWIFKCEMCNIETMINSDMTDNQNTISINKAVTSASLAVGIGYSQDQEFTACIDIPCMNKKSFIKNSNYIAKIIEESAWEEMRLAGLQEKQLALDRGDVDMDGIPTYVSCSGRWPVGKKKLQDKICFIATIIGFHTSKVLFVGIRSRYCVICKTYILSEQYFCRKM
ncbi:YqaJ domain-containing protein [Aphis craccivora]|uniref:YqaJ domain-containing protein n=1 Tax=Aphis craccivora TaxID=307492 RepID=A0A6G0XCM3_APHCR|nr:YqaJ domain-containing protein [Aphis craccivora]